MSRISGIVSIIACGLILSAGATAFAGVLNGNLLAYNDGNGPGSGGAWSGSAHYSNGSLEGDVDFAVFTGAGFAAAFPSASYTPTAGELIYAYQVCNGVGSPAVGFEGVSAAPADSIGSFVLESGDVAPDSEALVAGTAQWTFLAPEIAPGECSYGLVYSSTNRPELTGTSVTIDGGIPATAVVPMPGAVAIPEPASVLLGGMAGALATMLLRRRLV